jgi:CRP-like cAMP-binding protein
MTDQSIIQLKQAILFQDLPDELLKSLSNTVFRRTLATGDVLFRKGDAGDSLFVIGSGRVKIVAKDASGAELTINQCGPGEVVGEMSLFDQAPRSAGVVALEDSDVLELKRDSFLDLIDRDPDIALSVIKGMSHRLRYNTTFIQKATEWSKKIAEGDFSFIDQTQQRDDLSTSTDEDRATQFLSAFFAMARNVKKREDDLKREVEKLTIQIDENRRKQEFEELTNTDFYANLKAQAKLLRSQRADNE